MNTSPLPWTTWFDTVQDANGNFIADFGTQDSYDIGSANARLVVRAVTLHAELVAALEGVVTAVAMEAGPIYAATEDAIKNANKAIQHATSPSTQTQPGH